MKLSKRQLRLGIRGLTMANIADNANDLTQLEINSILSSRVPQEAAYYKLCRYCKESTPDGHAFCDKYCRDDFERLGG